ncbi:MAG: TetR/AcrR family transcriptional regulator [Bacteroidales bacterium]|nr:TetR/AcrR family transcriptional regulator [Bacteroidales bacterium]
MPNETTKNKIVSVASKLFGRYGFYKTSMDEIARISRKAKGSLYYHFKSKEELFTEVVAKEISSMQVQLSVIVTDSSLQADEKIKKYLLKRMEVLYSAANYHETLKADFFEHFDFIDNLRNEMDVWEKEQIKQIILQGIGEGVFAELKGDINVLLDVFIMVLKGLEIPFFLQEKYEHYEPYFDDLIKILIKGLGK